MILGKALFTKQGDIKGDINDIKLNIQNESGSNTTSSLSLNSIFEQIKNLENHEELFSKNIFYNYGYSVNVNNLNVIYNGISITGLRANIQLDKNLKFKSFVTEVPKYKDDNLDFEKIAFRSSNDGNIYSFAISGDKLLLINNSSEIVVDQARATLKFHQFSELELNRLPLDLSVDKIYFKNDQVTINLGPLSVQNINDGASYSISKINGNYNDYLFNSSVINGKIAVSQDLESNLSVNIPDKLTLSYLDSSIIINNIKLDASYLSSLSLDANIENLLIKNINSFSYNLINDGKLSNLNLALQYINSEAFIDVNTDLNISSELALLDNTNLNASISSYIKNKKISDLSIKLNEIKLPLMPYSLDIYYSQKEDGKELDAYYQDKLSFTLADKELFIGSINLSGFRGSDIKDIINTYSPFFNKYILDDTLINGSISFSASKDRIGNIYSTLALDNIHFNENTFGIASGLDAKINENNIDDIKLNITSELIRFAYDGSISLDTLLPEGNISINYTKTGNPLLDVSISLGNNKQYDFLAKVLNRDKGFIQGSINWAKEGLVQALGKVKSSASIYPFDLSLDVNSKKIDLISDHLILSADYSNQLSMILS